MKPEVEFTYKGMEFYAEEISREDSSNLDRDLCTGCYFYNGGRMVECGDIHKSKRIICASEGRKDDKNVIFKKIEKGE